MLKFFVIFGFISATFGQIQPNFPSFPTSAPATNRPPPMEPMVPNFPIFPPVNPPVGVPTSRPPDQWPNNPQIGTSPAPIDIWPPAFPVNPSTARPVDTNPWPPAFPTNPPIGPPQTDNNSFWPPVVPSVQPTPPTARPPSQEMTFPPILTTRQVVTRPPVTRPPASRPPATRQPTTFRPPNNNQNPLIKPIDTLWGTARYDSRCQAGMTQNIIYIPDETNCRKFYMCNFGIAWLMSCPPSVTGNVIWSQQDNACREVADPMC